MLGLALTIALTFIVTYRPVYTQGILRPVTWVVSIRAVECAQCGLCVLE